MALLRKMVRHPAVCVTLPPGADNGTCGCRFRTGFVFYLWQRRFGPTGEERRENCAWTAHEESSVSGCTELLRRPGLACPTNGSVAPMGPDKTPRTEGVYA